MVRFDMSEFQERHTVSRLVGAPPGLRRLRGGRPADRAVRRRPYSVLLFDEIEKAHPDVFNILLQILDDGRLTDAQGRTVDFKHTRRDHDLEPRRRPDPGSTRAAAESFEQLKDELMELLRRSFRPEFINRIDEIIVFRALRRSSCSRSPGCCSTGSPPAARAGDRGRVHRRGRRLLAQRGLRPGVRRAAAAADDPAAGRERALAHGARRRGRPRRPGDGRRPGGRSAALPGREGRGARLEQAEVQAAQEAVAAQSS